MEVLEHRTLVKMPLDELDEGYQPYRELLMCLMLEESLETERLLVGELLGETKSCCLKVEVAPWG